MDTGYAIKRVGLLTRNAEESRRPWVQIPADPPPTERIYTVDYFYFPFFLPERSIMLITLQGLCNALYREFAITFRSNRNCRDSCCGENRGVVSGKTTLMAPPIGLEPRTRWRAREMSAANSPFFSICWGHCDWSFSFELTHAMHRPVRDRFPALRSVYSCICPVFVRVAFDT